MKAVISWWPHQLCRTLDAQSLFEKESVISMYLENSMSAKFLELTPCYSKACMLFTGTVRLVLFTAVLLQLFMKAANFSPSVVTALYREARMPPTDLRPFKEIMLRPLFQSFVSFGIANAKGHIHPAFALVLHRTHIKPFGIIHNLINHLGFDGDELLHGFGPTIVLDPFQDHAHDVDAET